ncbi:MAG: SDR family oxidoreductase [Polyangiales bacterium]
MIEGLDLDDKSILVTGGGRGIGRGITHAFLEASAKVTVCGRREPEALPRAGGNTASFVQTDVRDPSAVEAMIDQVVSETGGLDVLINNAGGAPFAEAATASPRFSEKVIQLNLTAALHCSQQANRVMQGQPSGGSIINVASVSGLRPSPGTAAYGAAKAGLLNLTTSLAVEWAPKVRVNAIAAGLILTEQAHLHYGDDAGVARVADTIPMGRLGTPEDIAGACLFFASGFASYVTGAHLVLHGGGETPAFLDAAKGRG